MFAHKVGIASLFLFWGCTIFAQEMASPSPVSPSSSSLPATVKEWWSTSPAPNQYAEQVSLISGYVKKELSSLPDKAHPPKPLLSWIILQEWLSLYTGNNVLVMDADKIKAFTELGQEENIPLLFLSNLSAKDNISKAVEILCNLYLHDPENVKKFPELAVAFALVHDNPFPKDWPHHQVSQNLVSRDGYSIEAHFDFFVESQKKYKLLQDLSKLAVSQLKFIVDSNVSISELEWAQKNVKFSRGQFDNAFSSIKYDYSRIRSKAYSWPQSQGKYSLENIQTLGGICVDQAYFAYISGKARGLPTLYFHGQGTDGGHAWFGYLRTPDKWELNCGRYANQNYCVGYANDPQTWEEINDAQLKQLADKVEEAPDYTSLRIIFRWILENKNEFFYAATLDDLRKALPNYAPIWRASADIFSQSAVSDDEKIKFWEKWIIQFTFSPDIKVEGQENLANLYEKVGRKNEADALKRQIIVQNKRKRFDIGIGKEAEGLLDLVEEKSFDKADGEFRKLVRAYDDKAGGLLFYEIVRPYVYALLDAGEAQGAVKAYKYVDKKFSSDPNSLLREELGKLKSIIEEKSGVKLK